MMSDLTLSGVLSVDAEKVKRESAWGDYDAIHLTVKYTGGEMMIRLLGESKLELKQKEGVE